MTRSITTVLIFFLLSVALNVTASNQTISMDKIFQGIEKKHHATVGVYVIDTNSGKTIAYHANDRFPFQSTFKLMAAAALLYQDQKTPLLAKTVLIKPNELVPWHPVSGQYINKRVSLKTLARGAVSYSDNTAINKIIHALGGPNTINRFVHSLGDLSFNLQHYEINLNSNPKRIADTATPKNMAFNVKTLLLGDTLTLKNKTLLRRWLKDSTTGNHRIRAGVPLGWIVADKTGSGHYGVANDIGMAWSEACKPIILTIYTHTETSHEKSNDRLIAELTHHIFKGLANHDTCFKATTL